MHVPVIYIIYVDYTKCFQLLIMKMKNNLLSKYFKLQYLHYDQLRTKLPACMALGVVLSINSI